MKANQTTHGSTEEMQERIDHDKLTLETLAMGARSQQLLTKAILIGGSVALGYLIYRQFMGKRSGVLSALLMGAASMLTTQQGKKLLSAGKEKLDELVSRG